MNTTKGGIMSKKEKIKQKKNYQTINISSDED